MPSKSITPSPYRFELGDRVSITMLGKTYTGVIGERYSFNARNFYNLVSDRAGFSVRFVSQPEEKLTLLTTDAEPSPENVRAWANAFNQL